MALNTLVIFRLGNPALRKKLSARLKDRGFSPAPGIFECDFSHAELQAFREELSSLSYETGSFIIIYSICAACARQRFRFGSPDREPDTDDDWIIF